MYVESVCPALFGELAAALLNVVKVFRLQDSRIAVSEGLPNYA